MSDPAVVPQDVDPDKPNTAGMYDFYLGGNHNFAADRAAGAADTATGGRSGR